MSYILTITGKHFDPFYPDSELLCLEDMAHSLSFLARGNGHEKHFHSVAQHSIDCAREAEARGHSARVQLACLLHDGCEAYLSDVPSPLKEHMPEYCGAEDRLTQLIFARFITPALTEEELAQVFSIDHDYVGYEFHELMVEELSDFSGLLTRPPMQERPMQEVEAEFLSLGSQLLAAL